MSIIIKGMEMQDSCYECPINKDDGFGYFTCGVTKNECDFRKLPCDCPLIPVPDHGRLIDADALEQDAQKRVLMCNKNDNQFQKPYEVMRAISLAPTIIPAEEGE